MRPEPADPRGVEPPVLASTRRDVADYWEWYELAIANKWTEGLPVCPPALEKVVEVIDYLGRRPEEVIGSLPPTGGLATIEQVAINAVMAGCTPQLVPVVIAAVEAMLEPKYELFPVQVTTNGAAPLVIVSGPAVDRLGFNPRYGAFAGSSRAAATVGRAVRLVLRNIGGAIPGETSNVVHGHPGWMSYCVAENGAESPWEPYHVQAGFAAETSCVTVFFCQAPFPLYVPGSTERILRVLAASLPTPGINMYFGAGQVLLAFAVKPAMELARAGYTRADVQQWVWEHARYNLGRLRSSGVFEHEAHTYYWGARNPAPDLGPLGDDAMLPLVDGPGDIHILVSGGPGQWWVAFCPGWGEFGGYAVTRPIQFPGEQHI